MSFFYLGVSESPDGHTWTVGSGITTLTASSTAATFSTLAATTFTGAVVGDVTGDVTGDLDAEFITIGSLATPLSSEAEANSIHQIISISQDEDIGADHTIGASYVKTATGKAQAGQLATAMVRTSVQHNVFDAYGLQSHLSFGDTKTISTTDNNAHLTAISGKVTFDTTTVTKGWVNAGLFIVEGAGTCSQICHGVSIVEEAGSTGTQSLLHLRTDVGTTPAIQVTSADGSGKTVYTAADTSPTVAGSIMISINGTDKYLRFYDSQAAGS